MKCHYIFYIYFLYSKDERLDGQYRTIRFAISFKFGCFPIFLYKELFFKRDQYSLIQFKNGHDRSAFLKGFSIFTYISDSSFKLGVEQLFI